MTRGTVNVTLSAALTGWADVRAERLMAANLRVPWWLRLMATTPTRSWSLAPRG
jgi:hypothetical protein